MDKFSSSKNPFRPSPPPLSWPLFSCAFTDNLMECLHGSVERVPPAVLPLSEDSSMAFLIMCFKEYVRVRISSNLAEPVEHDTSMSDEMEELLIEIDKFRLGNSEEDDKFRMGNSEEDDKFRMGNSEGYDFTRNYKKDGSLSNNPSRKLQKLMEFKKATVINGVQ